MEVETDVLDPPRLHYLFLGDDTDQNYYKTYRLVGSFR